MKQFIQYVFIITLLFSSSGCEKYLDIKPKGVDVVSTTDQYNGLFNSTLLLNYGIVYIDQNSFVPGPDANLTTVLSDEVHYSTEYNTYLASSYTNAFRWLPNIYLPDQEPAEWSALYGHIYTYNVIANGVQSATDGTSIEQKQLLAEARANRAFHHFILVNYFGKPFNASTASTDPGVPIITKPQAANSAGPRSSVREVYDFALGEMKAAITDLPETTINRLRLAKPAALCMLGQMFFEMGYYDSALTQLNLALTLLPASEATMALYDYNVEFPSWTPPFPNFPPNIPLPVNNTEVIYPQLVAGSLRGSVFLTDKYKLLYDTSDTRLKLFVNADYSGTIIYPELTRAAPFQVNYGPSLPNLYLMLAECKARTGDVSGAVSDLTELRNHRLPAAAAVVPSLSKDDLIRFIVDERYREYACTGFNWFDVRRLWKDPLFANKTYVHQDTDGSYTLTEDRLTLKIPPKIININPSMVNNP